MGVFSNFPYTNFHEMNMDWLLEQVRKISDEWDQYKTDMDLWKLGVDDQLAEFQSWFDNLDVQDEVRTVINELIQSGEFIEITSPQIVSATEAWLAAHITPTTPAVDDTLSISGAAADAKVTGDRITDLKEDFEKVASVTVVDDSTITGFSLTMNNNQSLSPTGEIITGGQNGWMVSDGVNISEYDYLIVTAGSGYNHLLYAFYDNTQTFISGLNSGSAVLNITDENVRIPDNAVYFRIARNASAPCSASGVIVAYKNILAGTITELKTDFNKVKDATTTAINATERKNPSKTDNRVINTDGTISSGSNNAWKVSDPVDLTGYDYLILTAGSGYNHLLYAFYTSEDVFISGLNSGAGVSNITEEDVTIPQNAKYVRVAKNGNADMEIICVKIVLENSALAKWEGKKWTVVGDSLTEHNIRTTMNYHDYIANETGITVYNMGVSGSGYRKLNDQNKAFYQRILDVPTDSDVVTILGSANDTLTDLGTETDTGTTTIGGCINTTIENLYSIMPVVQLGIIAPAPVIYGNPYDNTSYNAYVQLLENICKRRSIPFLNLYYESNLRPWDSEFRELAYTKDDGNGVHPDETGHELIASRIKEFLESLIL